ncbi:MAG: DUF1684 domain-containing protein [Bacteroidetes bacterium]|nr:DUF1684 domain-containing protein [Bacteroidota bacterium]
MNKIFLFLVLLGLWSCGNKEREAHHAAVVAHRAHTNNQFVRGDGPLEPADAAVFSGLKYYPISHEYNLTATLEPLFEPVEVLLRQGDTSKLMWKFGHVVFTWQANTHKLLAFTDMIPGPGDSIELFVPFFDQTNGVTTYEGGRYVYPALNKDGTVNLDFNLASNPYCAYNHKYNCVVPPADNELPLKVEAGEMRFK